MQIKKRNGVYEVKMKTSKEKYLNFGANMQFQSNLRNFVRTQDGVVMMSNEDKMIKYEFSNRQISEVGSI
jgi:hypothetical protein